MNIKAVVLHHLEYTFEKEAWQPPLATAIEGLTGRQAPWQPAPERHSIWQIVRHVTQWKQATIGAWEGSRPLYGASGPTEHYFETERTDWANASGDDAAWEAERTHLHTTSRRLRERVEASDEAALWRPFPGEEMPAALRLLRLATHDVYHAGQIRYLRALQGV